MQQSPITIDNYHVKIDRSSQKEIVDFQYGSTTGAPELSSNDEKQIGGNSLLFVKTWCLIQ